MLSYHQNPIQLLFIIMLKDWQLPDGFQSVRTMHYTNLHTKIFLLKHGKFEKILTPEGQ